jgi:hypothetical protein
VKQQSKPIFWERINCSTKQAKFIIDDASSRLGIAPQHKITADMIQQEEEEISLADFIFCPSPEVKKSFMGAGVPEHKLILTSYGWSPNASRIFRSTSHCQTRLLFSLWAVFGSEKELICCCRLGKKRELKAYYCFAEVWSQQLLKLAAEF